MRSYELGAWAGREQRLTVRFPDPTGISIVLADSQGRRLFDADTVLFLRPKQTRGATNVAQITRFRAGTHGPLHVLHSLDPGSWRFLAFKRGHGIARGTFQLSVGQVRHIRAVLEEVTR